MPYEFKNDRDKRDIPQASRAAYFVLFAMLLVTFFLGYALANLERSLYYEDSIDGFSVADILLTSSTHTFIPTAEAYPYSYYNPYHTYYTQYDNYDRGYYDRPAYDYPDNFNYYDYDTRPNYYLNYEFTIDWEDPDNWSPTTGKPILKNWGYKVTEEPIVAFDDYSIGIVIFPSSYYYERYR